MRYVNPLVVGSSPTPVIKTEFSRNPYLAPINANAPRNALHHHLASASINPRLFVVCMVEASQNLGS